MHMTHTANPAIAFAVVQVAADDPYGAGKETSARRRDDRHDALSDLYGGRELGLVLGKVARLPDGTEAAGW
jgi:hypothetical protein